MLAHVPPHPRTTIQYKPVGSARDLIAARELEVLAVGPAGTGKTLAACWKIHLACLRYPGIRVLMVRKTLESLKSGALNTFINGVQPARFGVQTFGGNKFFPAEFRYPNGSVILVSGMDKAEKILSAEFDIIYVNEITEPGFLESDLEVLLTRLRNGKMPYQQIIADGNPSGPRHWMNKRCNEGKTRRITSTHKDNPVYWDARKGDWTDVGRQYVQTVLAGLTGVQRKRLFEGVWAAAEGLVYQEFNPDTHIKSIPPEELATWKRVVLGEDVGSTNPTVILVGHQRGDGHLHISHELYRRGMSSSDITDATAQFWKQHKPDKLMIDPSAKGYITDLRRQGIYVEAAQNDILVGIQRVHGQFQTGFSVDPSCTNTIDEFGMYAYPDNPKVDTDKPIKENDHGMDALRYLVMGITEPTIDLKNFFGT